MNDAGVLMTAYVVEDEWGYPWPMDNWNARVQPVVFFDETEALSYLALVEFPGLVVHRVAIEVRRSVMAERVAPPVQVYG